MQAEVVRVTPEMAKEWLKRGNNFRAPTPSVVQKYARLMTEKKWVVNGESIKFDGKNHLLDGQHRLLACVLANVPFQTLVVKGAKMEAVDEGLNRNLSQWLKYKGETNTTSLASVVRFVHTFTVGGGKPYARDGFSVTTGLRSVRPSISEYLDYLEENPGLRESAAMSRKVSPKGLIQPAILGGLHYLFAEKNKEMADQFVEGLCGNLDLEHDDPVFILRKRLLEEIGNPHNRSNSLMRTALCIKAWNFWCVGEKTSRLMWRGWGAKPEPFPTIMSPQE